MPLVLADRVRETTTTTGQGTVTLAGAVTGFQSFSVIGNGNTTYYTIAGQGTSEWEVGIGTYTAAGTTLSRDTVLASSAGAPTKTTFSAGTKDVFVTYTAARSVYADGTSIASPAANLTANRVMYATSTSAIGQSANLTFNGTTLTANDITDSSLTSGRVTYAGTGGNLVDSANLTFNGTTLTSGGYSTGGNLTFTGTGNRITGDFSNATLANRVLFQTSTTNNFTLIGAIPNGTSKYTQYAAWTGSTANESVGYMAVDGGASGAVSFGSDRAGTGTYLPILFFTGGSERMRIDTSGNVGIGTSSPSTYAGKLTVLEGYITAAHSTSASYINWYSGGAALNQKYWRIGTSSGALLFETVNDAYTTPTERARIDSSGNLLVGEASQTWDERLSAKRTTNAVVGGFYSSATTYTSSVIRAQTEAAAGTGWYLFEGRAAGGSFQYGIRGNGTVATSDERRKKNIEPARSYLQDICSIPIVKYNWKTDADDAPKELGWLAQDVEKVFPNMVVTHHDGPNDDQEVLLLKKEVFVPMLMKCIQEQQAMIDELKAEIAALKGNA